MTTDILPIPGILLGSYPERRHGKKSAQVAPAEALRRLLRRPAVAGRYQPFMDRVLALDADTGALDETAIAGRLARIRAGLARERLSDALVAEAFVVVRQVCARELGLDLHATQLLAARIMLDGQLAEMATGEGKTVAAGVCAATAALAGIPVHVMTANDYLVARDAEFLRPLYNALGLSVAAVTQPLEPDARRRAYDADIVYCTAGEVVFDYLRDGLVRGRVQTVLQQRVSTLSAPAMDRRTLLRGLCMAIVDEADSILIDEARVPLILSERATNEQERGYLEAALRVASELEAHVHFELRRAQMSAVLTDAGRALLDDRAKERLWKNRLHREETVCTALAALHLFEKDRHYLVRDNNVTIIDECTGRIAAGRVWSRGLHRLVELKESCNATGDMMTVAQITYQRFFQRYLSLAGMSGTLSEARGELAAVYGLRVVKVPLHRPDGRTVLPTRIYAERESLWEAVIAEAVDVSLRGQPVLVGTDSVVESEALSERFTRAGISHAVLNARQDAEEAHVIAEAGQAGRITVATNMAGRGTDIALGAGVADAGGLHVISCQHNASRRIDRQLLGRCARRGDPGSARTLLSADKPLIKRYVPRVLSRFLPAVFDRPQWFVRAFATLPQRLEERRQRAQRTALLRHDLRATESSSFARPLE
jgi:preprotein translocase subunit SecA